MKRLGFVIALFLLAITSSAALVITPGTRQHDHTSASDGGVLTTLTQITAPTSFPVANSVVLTNIPQVYSAIILSIDDISFDTDVRAFAIYPSTDNGSTYVGSIIKGHYIRNSTVVDIVTNNVLNPNTMSPATNTGDYSVTLFGYASGSFKQVLASGSDTGPQEYSGMVTISTTSGINALKIEMTNTGNFDGGTYALYGLR